MQCEKQFPRNSHLKRHLKLLHENTPKQIGRPLKDEKDLSANTVKNFQDTYPAISGLSLTIQLFLDFYPEDNNPAISG